MQEKQKKKQEKQKKKKQEKQNNKKRQEEKQTNVKRNRFPKQLVQIPKTAPYIWVISGFLKNRPVNLVLVDVHHPDSHIFRVLQQLGQSKPCGFHLLARTAPISRHGQEDALVLQPPRKKGMARNEQQPILPDGTFRYIHLIGTVQESAMWRCALWSFRFDTRGKWLSGLEVCTGPNDHSSLEWGAKTTSLPATETGKKVDANLFQSQYINLGVSSTSTIFGVLNPPRFWCEPSPTALRSCPWWRFWCPDGGGPRRWAVGSRSWCAGSCSASSCSKKRCCGWTSRWICKFLQVVGSHEEFVSQRSQKVTW